jgi:hypothetical protein
MTRPAREGLPRTEGPVAPATPWGRHAPGRGLTGAIELRASGAVADWRVDPAASRACARSGAGIYRLRDRPRRSDATRLKELI